MPTRAKRVIKSIAPPFLWEIGKDLKRRLLTSVDHFAVAPEGWSTRLPAGATSEDFWNRFIARERSICEALIARVKAGDPVSVLTGDMKEVLFGYVLALVARNKQKVSLLDYGGNLGDYYWLAQGARAGNRVGLPLQGTAAGRRNRAPDHSGRDVAHERCVSGSGL